MRLDSGSAAPDFALLDQDGATVRLDDLRGQKTVLYFYPAAMTPGCTTQACDFRDSISSLEGAGYRVIGVSRDEPAKLAEFRERDGLTFTLQRPGPRRAHRIRSLGREDELRQGCRRSHPLDLRSR